MVWFIPDNHPLNHGTPRMPDLHERRLVVDAGAFLVVAALVGAFARALLAVALTPPMSLPLLLVSSRRSTPSATASTPPQHSTATRSLPTSFSSNMVDI